MVSKSLKAMEKITRALPGTPLQHAKVFCLRDLYLEYLWLATFVDVSSILC